MYTWDLDGSEFNYVPLSQCSIQCVLKFKIIIYINSLSFSSMIMFNYRVYNTYQLGEGGRSGTLLLAFNHGHK